MDGLTRLYNGWVCSGGRCDRAEVLIGGGQVLEVAPRIDRAGAMPVDMQGMILSPGFVDLHVHLREPGFSQKETIETGTLAAAAGGFTTVCAMPNLRPVPDSRSHLDASLAALRRARVQVLPYGAITVGEAGETLAALEDMAPDCVGFSDDGKGVQSDALMREAMRRIAAMDGLLCAHCEQETLLPPGGCVHDGVAAARFGVTGIPSTPEWRQVDRDLRLVRETGVRYHVCHISCRETVALLRAAKAVGLPVSGECTPHQLALCDEDITEGDGRFKMNPPLRSRADREAIVDGLLDGTIDCIATDHAPHTAEEKAGGLSGSLFGVVGLETAFGVCHTALVQTGRMSLVQLVDRLTAVPARLIGRTAAIEPGAQANFALLDTSARWQVDPGDFHSMGRASPFAGRTLTGRIQATWFDGKHIYARGETQ